MHDVSYAIGRHSHRLIERKWLTRNKLHMCSQWLLHFRANAVSQSVRANDFLGANRFPRTHVPREWTRRKSKKKTILLSQMVCMFGCAVSPLTQQIDLIKISRSYCYFSLCAQQQQQQLATNFFRCLLCCVSSLSLDKIWIFFLCECILLLEQIQWFISHKTTKKAAHNLRAM